MAAVLTWPVGRAAPAHSKPPFAPVAAYVGGCAAGGMAVGTALGLAAAGASTVPGADVVLTAVIVAGALVTAALQWTGRMGPLPERRAQVPRHWLLWRRRSLTAACFGLMIGCGVLTHVKHPSAYVLAALILLVPTPLAGAVVGAAYGLGRGSTLGLTWLADRYVGRRPRWLERGFDPRILNRFLAAAAVLSVAGALSLV